MNNLIPCPECNRHLKRQEAACPFCGAAVARALAQAPERAMPSTRLGRSALFVFAAASVGAAACSSSDASGGTTGTIKGDAAAGGSSQNTGGEMGVPFYGAPFPTGGRTGAGGNPSAGGNLGSGGELGVALYGLPAFTGGRTGMDPDAGDAAAGAGGGGSGGNFAAIYGAAPAPSSKP